jgi:hypothetical protein
VVAEAEVAAAVVAWFKDGPWEIYQEVPCSGGVADIVATDQNRVWIIEVKRSLTFGLIDQARRRLKCAHWVSVAVPSGARSDTSYYMLRHFGIGLVLPSFIYGRWEVRESIEPKINRAGHKGAKRLISRLEPEHKTAAKAGSAGGGHWTPFKRTCKHALGLVQKNGPMTMRELMDGIEHHYSSHSSARSTFLRMVDINVVPGLELDKSKKPYLVKEAVPY